MEQFDAAIPLVLYLWATSKTLVSSLVTFVVFMFFTRYFDRRTKINWRSDVWPEIRRGNLAMGLYMGFRILACAVVAVAIGVAVR